VLRHSIDQTLLLAKSHANKGEFEKAKVLYQSVLAAYPNNQRARHALSNLNRTKGVQSEAKNPPQVQIDSLIALFNQRQFKQASNKAEWLIQEFPLSFVAWNILGIISKMLGFIEKSEQCFRRAINIHSEYFEAHTNLGNVCLTSAPMEQFCVIA
jgi:tetratricopeptide (TPR) repeat protein